MAKSKMNVRKFGLIERPENLKLLDQVEGNRQELLPNFGLSIVSIDTTSLGGFISGNKKLRQRIPRGRATVKKNITFSFDDAVNIQAMADERGVTFSKQTVDLIDFGTRKDSLQEQDYLEPLGTVDPSDLKQVGNALARAREAAGLTQTDAAQRSGVSRPMISQIENGEANPKLVTLISLCRAYGIELRLDLGTSGPGRTAIPTLKM